MQLVAREMNLSETAFLVKREQGYDLRWFTPTVEVDLCGHATLASAHVHWEQGQLEMGEPVCFHTRSGVLTARKKGAWIEIDFPATPVKLDSGSHEDLELALGTKAKNVGRTRFDYFAEVESENAVRSLSPDFTKLGRMQIRGLIVTSAASSADCDFVSRFFAPGAGVDEDPVTGSAHCCLGPFWQGKLNKNEMRAYQASPRGGIIAVRV